MLHRISVPSTLLPFIVAFVLGIVSMSFGLNWLTALGVSAFIYYLVRLLQEAGVDLPIESFILFLASAQWIIGPVLAYAGFSQHYKFYMYVPESEYMLLAVPAILFYSIGLYAFRSNKRILLITHHADQTRDIVRRAEFLPYYLIGVGIVFSFIVDRLPETLAFPGFIFSNLKYVGLIYLIFSDRQKNKTAILILAFVLTFLSSLASTMFHGLILWTSFMGMYAAYIFRPSAVRKIFFLCVGAAFIFLLQAVKDEYRTRLWTQGEEQKVEKFITSVEDRFADDERLRSNNIERMVIRMNQGWIISRIMQRVPAVVPHADGQTVAIAIKTSLLPRLLFPDKPKAGGKKNYEKYTGYILQSGTSMGISLLGEAYINYGVKGAWAFMFLFGLISSFVIRKLFSLTAKYPTIWLWLPLVMLHFVKAETELLVQLNYLVKSILLVYLFVWANGHFFRLRL